jgi:hypothetical protein
MALALANRDIAAPLCPLSAVVTLALAAGCDARLRLKGGRLLAA